jgi:lactate permease
MSAKTRPVLACIVALAPYNRLDTTSPSETYRMLWAYHQHLDPLRGIVPWSAFWSTLFAALPVVVLFYLLVPRRWLAPKAGAAGALVAILIAVTVYGMPMDGAVMAFIDGAGFGLLPVGWTVFNAMLLYNITVETGQFAVVRRSVAGLSNDARIQAVLIGFAFGAFLEGAAGAGTPVAICGAIMVGLGFDPFQAAVLCLIANTSPVAYGGLGTPLIVLDGVTGLGAETLSVMAGRQLPFLSCLVPLYMVRCMSSWRQTWDIWPALLVAGGSFACFQFLFASSHLFWQGVVLFPMTDIGGGMFSLIVTAIFLRFWRPREELHFLPGRLELSSAGRPETSIKDSEAPLTAGRVLLAWSPYLIMSLMLLISGLIRQQEGRGPVHFGPVQTNYLIPVPWLDNVSHRDPRLHAVRAEHALATALASDSPISATVNVRLAERLTPRPERAEFNFAWLTSPGTPVLFASLISVVLLRMSGAQIRKVLRRTFIQMKIPIPTIACMLGLSYVTRFAGMDATLGIAFAQTGPLYPFFAAILGWLGVFLTGTDAGSNALFGSLQKITATELYRADVFTSLGQGLEPAQALGRAQVLICTANSTGGVMGKMIDAQSICVATAATHQMGREADIFKAVVWHSLILAAVVGLMTLAQAYLFPFTCMVPIPRGL